jgi:hypothetical protein
MRGLARAAGASLVSSEARRERADLLRGLIARHGWARALRAVLSGRRPDERAP